MPKTFELKFTKIADNLYSGCLSVEGQQMTFGVPKTKEEIYQFLFGGNSIPSATMEMPAVQATRPESSVPMENDGWRYVPKE
jgi:hypothetical protein